MAQARLAFSKATDTDVPAVLALVRSAYRGESSRAGWTTEADLVADERIDDAGVLDKIRQPQGAVLLARDVDDGNNQNGDSSSPGGLAACCELALRAGGGGEPATAYFGLFAVDPGRQGGGIGRQVLTEAEAYAAREWGAERMMMWVIWTRKELIDWYVRRGYRRTGETAPFPYEQLVNGKALRDDLHFVVLAKELGAARA